MTPHVRRHVSTNRHGRGMHGYMLIELLVVASIVCTALAVVLRVCATAQNTVRTHGDSTDLQQRLRVGVEAIRRDLAAAGAGLSRGSRRAPLVDAFAPILPARSGLLGADVEMSYHADRITLVSVPADAAQTTLSGRMAAESGPLQIDGSAVGCPTDGTCGFRAGDRVLIYSPDAGDGVHDIFTLSAVDAAASFLVPPGALSRRYDAGARVATVVQRVYYLDRPGRRLMVYDGDRSDLPVIDHVVDLRFTYYGDPSPTSVTPPPGGGANCAYAAGAPPIPLLQDLGGTALVPLTPAQLTDGPWCGQAPGRFDADLLRVRRIGVALRLEAEGAEFRGSGDGFANRGTSLDAERYVPDVQVTFDVAPGNLLETGMR
jgi:type II secretory pathway pseudopilin PulG